MLWLQCFVKHFVPLAPNFVFTYQIGACLLWLKFASDHAGDDGVALGIGLVYVGRSCCSSEVSLGAPTF
jgi:hypothetical protein